MRLTEIKEPASCHTASESQGWAPQGTWRQAHALKHRTAPSLWSFQSQSWWLSDKSHFPPLFLWFQNIFIKHFLYLYHNSSLNKGCRCRLCACVHVKSLQSWLTLHGPSSCDPPASSVYGILQARILQWVAMPSSFMTQGPNLCLFTSPALASILYH